MKNHIRSERHFALPSGEFADTKPATFAPLLLWLLGVPVFVGVVALVAVFS